MTYTDPVVAGTLDWCNERRKERGQEPLVELPEGRRDDPHSCPCGLATGLYVLTETYCESSMDSSNPRRHKMLPEAVRKFVVAFDNEEYPEFDLEPAND